MSDSAEFIHQLTTDPRTWSDEVWAFAVALAIAVFGVLWAAYEVVVYVM